MPEPAQELDGGGRANASRDVQSKVRIEKLFFRFWQQLGASFGQCFFPSLVGRQPGAGVPMVLVVMVDLLLEQLVRLVVITHFFIGEKSDEPPLKCPKEPLDFAFGAWGEGATR